MFMIDLEDYLNEEIGRRIDLINEELIFYVHKLKTLFFRIG
mgnify:FL=1